MTWQTSGAGARPKLWATGKSSGSSYETGTHVRPVQAPVRGQEGWYACSVHTIRYQPPPNGAASCPLCGIENREREKLKERDRRILDLERKVQNLEARVSLLGAMRTAVDLLNHQDLLGIKEIVYLWLREEFPVGIAIREVSFHSENGAGVRHEVAGFKAGGIEHLCSSVGGVAMARAFSEATKVAGRDEAAKMLAQAMSDHISVPDSWRDG